MKTLLLSRKFWAALIGVILMILSAFLPGLPDLAASLEELAGLLSAYILGSALEVNPLPAGQVWQGLFRSRKFWATLAGLLMVVIRAAFPDFPLSDDQISAIVITLSAYIFGTGLQDGLAQRQEQNHV